VALGR